MRQTKEHEPVGVFHSIAFGLLKILNLPILMSVNTSENHLLKHVPHLL